MKNWKNTFIILIMLLFSSCEDMVSPIAEFSDFKVLFSVSPEKLSGDIEVEQGEKISFMDLSQGIKEHCWIIPEGCKFVNDGNAKTSRDNTTKIEFTEPGLKMITLYNKFNHEFSFRDDKNTLQYNFIATDGEGNEIKKFDIVDEVIFTIYFKVLPKE